MNREHTTRRPAARRLASLAAVAALGMAAGCAERAVTAGPAAPPTAGQAPTPGTDTKATDPRTRAAAAAVAAYRAMWAAYETASATANHNDPSLPLYATGEALSTLQNGLWQMHQLDQVARGSAVLHPTVVSLSPVFAPTEVKLEDCADTSKSVLYHRDGGPVNDTPGGWRRVKAAVSATPSGAWKVSSFAVQAVGSCDGQ
jgi:hypothetical protein